MRVRFTVEGLPKGKGRPRFTSKGMPYTPSDTRAYENKIRNAYAEKYGTLPSFNGNTALRMELLVFMPVPKSDSKKERALKLDGSKRPTHKPDVDNVLKVYGDALNKLCYPDDKSIVSVSVEKFYGTIPRVEVFIEPAVLGVNIEM